MRISKKDKDDVNVITNRALRDQLVKRFDVLDKVKYINPLPRINMVSTKQLAEYYSITEKAIKTKYGSYKKEIDSIGSVVIPKDYYMDYPGCKAEKTQTEVIYTFENGMTLTINNRGLRVFSLSVVVYFSLLLRDNSTANQIKMNLGIPVNVKMYRKECVFIDKLDKVLQTMGIYGERWFAVKGNKGTYHIDYYINDYGSYTGLAIEYDENDHKNYTCEQQELRQIYIEDNIQCCFLRLSDKDDDETNIGKVMKYILEDRDQSIQILLSPTDMFQQTTPKITS